MVVLIYICSNKALKEYFDNNNDAIKTWASPTSPTNIGGWGRELIVLKRSTKGDFQKKFHFLSMFFLEMPEEKIEVKGIFLQK